MIDVVLLALIGVSALLGLLRGFVGTVVGTLSWLLAGWASFRFGAAAADWLAEGARPSTAQYLGGYALVFAGVLVAVAVAGMLVRAGVQAVRLDGTDRLLGFVLGALRGAVLGCVLVLLMGFTPLASEPAWRQSVLLPLLRPGADWMREQLPDWSVAGMDLGKPPAAGDNAALGQALPASVLAEAAARALGQAGAERGEAAQALPANIDPAQVRTGEPGPASAGSPPGQARPPSQ